MEFNELKLIPEILKSLTELGYTTPSSIQEQAIPPLLEGRDVLGCAQTGTGKTAAFAVPILQNLHKQPPLEPGKKRQIRALIMTPTRELAVQINDSFRQYGRYLDLKSTVIFGGVPQKGQCYALRRGVDILVATPGRLKDLMNQRVVNLANADMLVLDEADRMLDIGFIHDVKDNIRHMPTKRQTLLFSATMPNEVVKFVDELLKEPVKIAITPVSSTVDNIEQFIYHVDRNNKLKLMVELLANDEIKSALVFTRTKHGADNLVKGLEKSGVKALAIHGDKSQNARQAALNRFKGGYVRVLVATDIAARGIDIDSLSHVFNYDLPEVPETYVHRIGRTGRAGLGGIAIAFCSRDERRHLAEIEKLIKKNIPVIEDHDYALAPKSPSSGGNRNRRPRRDGASQAKNYKKPSGQKKADIKISGDKNWNKKASSSGGSSNASSSNRNSGANKNTSSSGSSRNTASSNANQNGGKSTPKTDSRPTGRRRKPNTNAPRKTRTVGGYTQK
ncbi:MAG: DEAD/DEAH box helicase [Oscillospiraceae bacterium]